MYCRLEVDDMDSVEEPSENGDPNSDIETSMAQCTNFRGVAAILWKVKVTRAQVQRRVKLTWSRDI